MYLPIFDNQANIDTDVSTSRVRTSFELGTGGKKVAVFTGEEPFEVLKSVVDPHCWMQAEKDHLVPRFSHEKMLRMNPLFRQSLMSQQVPADEGSSITLYDQTVSVKFDFKFEHKYPTGPYTVTRKWLLRHEEFADKNTIAYFTRAEGNFLSLVRYVECSGVFVKHSVETVLLDCYDELSLRLRGCFIARANDKYRYVVHPSLGTRFTLHEKEVRMYGEQEVTVLGPVANEDPMNNFLNAPLFSVGKIPANDPIAAEMFSIPPEKYVIFDIEGLQKHQNEPWLASYIVVNDKEVITAKLVTFEESSTFMDFSGKQPSALPVTQDEFRVELLKLQAEGYLLVSKGASFEELFLSATYGSIARRRRCPGLFVYEHEGRRHALYDLPMDRYSELRKTYVRWLPYKYLKEYEDSLEGYGYGFSKHNPLIECLVFHLHWQSLHQEAEKINNEIIYNKYFKRQKRTEVWEHAVTCAGFYRVAAPTVLEGYSYFQIRMWQRYAYQILTEAGIDAAYLFGISYPQLEKVSVEKLTEEQDLRQPWVQCKDEIKALRLQTITPPRTTLDNLRTEDGIRWISRYVCQNITERVHMQRIGVDKTGEDIQDHSHIHFAFTNPFAILEERIRCWPEMPVLKSELSDSNPFKKLMKDDSNSSSASQNAQTSHLTDGRTSPSHLPSKLQAPLPKIIPKMKNGKFLTSQQMADMERFISRWIEFQRKFPQSTFKLSRVELEERFIQNLEE